jgi:hypothetical protein
MSNETAGWHGESPNLQCGEDVKNRNIPVTAEAMSGTVAVENLSKSSVTCIMAPRFNDDGDAAAGPAATRRLPPQLVNPAH